MRVRELPTLLASSLLLVVLLSLPVSTSAAEKLPAEIAGELGEPEGKIAFIRNGNVWAMDANGRNQEIVCEATNADGRLSWSLDRKRIMFTRSGLVDLKGPDGIVGGKHKVYDLFYAWMDSAYANNPLFWTRLTDDLGSRDPEIDLDGTVIFYKDMNANTVNAGGPNYQVCTMSIEGDDFKVLRKDWMNFSDHFLLSPSLSPTGQIAAVAFYDLRPQGLVVLPMDHFMVPIDTIQAQAERNLKKVAPCWSPDGQWLAYVNNDIDDGGLYIATPDLKKHYLVFTPPVGAYLYTVAPSFSPNSKWLTFSTTDGSVWVCDITGQSPRRLTGPGLDKNPAWSKGPAAAAAEADQGK